MDRWIGGKVAEIIWQGESSRPSRENIPQRNGKLYSSSIYDSSIHLLLFMVMGC